MRKSLLLCLAFLVSAGMALAQDRTVSGKVTSAEDGSAVPGVNIVVKGTTTGAVTDIDGNYKLSVPAEGGTLIFSFIGLETQEIAIGNRSVVDVSLVSDAEQLSEVIVTALGIERSEASIGYAVTQVSGDDISAAGNDNMIDALNGKVAGVQITNAGGMPGGGTSMIIRGFSSVNFNNQPLYVVDGIPINNDSQFGGTISGTASANRAVDLNPDDIETISVLKGGAATALYGIRAGNGAVIITTKKGKGGAKGLNIEYSYRHSFDKVNKHHEITSDFARGRYGVYSNVTHWSWGENYAANPVFPAGTSVDLNGDGTSTDESGNAIPRYDDNYGRFWQDGATDRHNVNFSGSSDVGSFYGSVSTLNQTGVVPNSDYYKYSFLVNADIKVNDKIRYSAKVNYIPTGGKRFRTSTGILEGLGYWHNMWDAVNYPWKDDTGYKTWFSGGVPHPQWIVNEEGEDWNLNRWIGSMALVYDIIPWVTADLRFGMDNYSERRKEVRPYGSVNTSSNLGDITETFLTNLDFSADAIIRGQGDLSADLDLSYVAGFNVFRTSYDRIRSTGTSFVLPGLDNLGNTLSQTVSTYESGRMLLGAYGDITLGFRNMLYLQVTGRNDWSSTLPLENNSFFYPSASLSFIASEIWQPNWLSLLKVRGSYSAMANDAPVQSLYDVYEKVDPNVFGRPRFTTSNTQNNPNLKPEKSTEIEFGLDFRVFNNLLGLDAAFYDRTTTDQIIYQPVSAASGYSSKLLNLGEVRNKGIELMLTINDPVKVKDLSWTTFLTFTKNVGEVVRLGESTTDDLDRINLAYGWWSNAEMMAIEGEAYGTIVGYAYERYGSLTADEKGFLDQPLLIDADGLPIQSSQKTILGNTSPDWIAAISSNLGYKGINFGFTLERRQGGDVVNGFESNLVYSGLSVNTQDRWYADDAVGANSYGMFEGFHSDGTPNVTPGALSTDFFSSVHRRVDENIVEDASWWRLRNIYVGYSLPQSLLENIFLTRAEVTFSARNAWLSTKYRGNDPELSAHGAGNISGFDELMVPGTKSFEIGIKVGF